MDESWIKVVQIFQLKKRNKPGGDQDVIVYSSEEIWQRWWKNRQMDGGKKNWVGDLMVIPIWQV
jgi:hypothetical protein